MEFPKLKPRNRGIALWGTALVFIVMCFGLTRSNDRIFESRQDSGDASESTSGQELMRLKEGIREVTNVSKRETSIRSALGATDLIATPLAKPAVPVAQTDISMLRGKSLVVLTSGKQRYLVVDDQKYRVGDKLADGSVLVRIGNRDIGLLSPDGKQQFTYEFGSAAPQPVGMKEKQK